MDVIGESESESEENEGDRTVVQDDDTSDEESVQSK